MKTTDAVADLLRLDRLIFSTRETAVRLGVSVSRASQLLGSLQKSGLSRRVGRGLWTPHREIDPFVVPPYLTTPYPAYVSLWSALARHDMIEQPRLRTMVRRELAAVLRDASESMIQEL